MPDSKYMKWEDGYGTDAGQKPQAEDAKLDSKEPAANDADGWQQYRRWISKADTVKRNWTRDEKDDE